MKVRKGFVSNSSSSSFVIERKYITDKQWDLLVNRDEKFYDVLIKFMNNPYLVEKLSKENQYDFNYLKSQCENLCLEEIREYCNDHLHYDYWEIIEKTYAYDLFKTEDPDDSILFRTYMDNFDMYLYLDMLGVDSTKIIREGY